MRFCDLGEAQILQIVEPIMDNCLAGSNEHDHARHVRDFSDRIKKIVTPEELRRQLAAKDGVRFTTRTFVRLFRRRDSVGIVWRQLASGSDDELINQAIFKEIDGRVLIDHCMIC